MPQPASPVPVRPPYPNWEGKCLLRAPRSQDSLCPFSFPGGKCDPTDQDVIQTALRETQEELGLEVTKEHVWGVLQPVYDRVSHPHPVTLTLYPKSTAQFGTKVQEGLQGCLPWSALG